MQWKVTTYVMTVSGNGQVFIPAQARARWKTRKVIVVDHLVRVVGADEEEATLDLAQLGLLEGSVVGSTLGAEAGRLRARRSHRARCDVSMADCIAAQTARSNGEPLATSGPHLLDLCHQEGIPTVVLPRSDGSIWATPS